MEPHTEVTMFRGIQEVLGYTREVSSATRIDVILDITGSPIKADITFNGTNVDDTEVAAAQSSGKLFSLGPLRERVQLVGGTMEFAGDADGNRVEITLPAETLA